jgi:hypothetical protein
MKCDVKGTDALKEAEMLKVLTEIIKNKSLLMFPPVMQALVHGITWIYGGYAPWVTGV